jgi:AcrR family transcriptional regulator
MPQGPRRPRRRLDEERRPEILAAATELIREHGLWSVRISDVARRAGLSSTTTLYYFGSKDQLLAEAISGADEAFYEAVLSDATEERATARLVSLIVRSSTSEWLLWMELWVYSRHHPEAAEIQHRLDDRWRAALTGIIEHGHHTGEWQVPDPAGAATRLGALMDGLAVHMVLGDPDRTPEHYVEMTLVAAARELGCDLDELRREAASLPIAEVSP